MTNKASNKRDRLVKKEYGKVYACVSSEEAANALLGAEIFRFNLHGANVRLRELKSDNPDIDYVKICKRVLAAKHIREAIFLLPKTASAYLWGLSVYEEREAAVAKSRKISKTHEVGQIVELTVYTNITKDEQKKS